MQSSVKEIRFRLFGLLLRAFLVVILFLLLIFFAVTGYVLTFQPDIAQVRFPFVTTLEGYYVGHGSWDGVETIFSFETFIPIKNSLLLDKDARILLDRGTDSVSSVGSLYEISPRDVVFNLRVNGEQVGTLVVTEMPAYERLRFAVGILTPVGAISILLAIFVALIAVLLVRRFVNPLADVIYAARQVADGKLNTRISNDGPQDLRSLSESFNEMASSLERSDHQRRDMLADIAHELRTPLSVIRGRLEGIIDGIYTADSGQVSLALQQTYLLERLVDDLRLLTLAETRQLHFEKKTVNLNQLAQHTLELFSAEAREKNIALSLESASENIKVEVDPQRVEQVIGNLIGNSLRYTPSGSKVWLTLNETDGHVELCVNDNGGGVAEQNLPFLFDRFWRKDKSRSRTAGGTGLGLAITKQFIEAQGGTIEARNLPDGGLQIQILLKGI